MLPQASLSFCLAFRSFSVSVSEGISLSLNSSMNSPRLRPCLLKKFCRTVLVSWSELLR